MGWFLDSSPGHEGYLIAFVERGAGENGSAGQPRYRELAYPRDAEPRSDIDRLAVGCDCGWRSPHLYAPPARAGLAWHPYSVEAPEGLEELGRAIWRRHVHDVRMLRSPAAASDAAAVTAREVLDALTAGARAPGSSAEAMASLCPPDAAPAADVVERVAAWLRSKQTADAIALAMAAEWELGAWLRKGRMP